MKEKKTLSLGKRLRTLLEKDRQQVSARLIEQASTELLGDCHFIYDREAAALAVVDIEKLKAFIQRVEEIRSDVNQEYQTALKKLGDNNGEAA